MLVEKSYASYTETVVFRYQINPSPALPDSRLQYVCGRHDGIQVDRVIVLGDILSMDCVLSKKWSIVRSLTYQTRLNFGPIDPLHVSVDSTVEITSIVNPN